MLITNRVAPVLVLQGGLLVKTVKFKKPTYVGDPINAVKIFNEKEVDELFLLDMDPPRKSSSVNYRLLEEIASEAFMPVAYGGGVSSIDIATRVVGLGMEKIVVTSAWHREAQLVPELVSVLGSQAVVGGIDYRSRRGTTEVVIEGGMRRVGLTIQTAADRLIGMGVGELLIQSVDRDGTMSGMDTVAVAAISSGSSVPVVAVGGAGTIADLHRTLDAGASAVGASSMFVFHGRHRAVLITYPHRDLILGHE